MNIDLSATGSRSVLKWYLKMKAMPKNVNRLVGLSGISSMSCTEMGQIDG